MICQFLLMLIIDHLKTKTASMLLALFHYIFILFYLFEA